jgi:hypothetical protein
LGVALPTTATAAVVHLIRAQHISRPPRQLAAPGRYSEALRHGRFGVATRGTPRHCLPEIWLGYWRLWLDHAGFGLLSTSGPRSQGHRCKVLIRRRRQREHHGSVARQRRRSPPSARPLPNARPTSFDAPTCPWRPPRWAVQERLEGLGNRCLGQHAEPPPSGGQLVRGGSPPSERHTITAPPRPPLFVPVPLLEQEEEETEPHG